MEYFHLLRVVGLDALKNHYNFVVALQCKCIQDTVLFELIKVFYMFCVCGGGRGGTKYWGRLVCHLNI